MLGQGSKADINAPRNDVRAAARDRHLRRESLIKNAGEQQDDHDNTIDSRGTVTHQMEGVLLRRIACASEERTECASMNRWRRS